MHEQGRRLGPVGGRIVAEVLIGLLVGDPLSFLGVAPNWTPTLPGPKPGKFTMADLIAFATGDSGTTDSSSGETRCHLSPWLAAAFG